MKICPTCQQTYSDEVEFCPHDGTHLTEQATHTEAQIASGLSRRFRIVRRLGTGGMGTVFLAEQIGVGNRLVALKVLKRQLLDDPEFLLRFQAEASSTGRIRHVNVVTVHESGQGDDGTPYIAMEFLEGESLRQALKWGGTLPVAEVAEILTQVARGLNSAHKLGMIHRDLKPDNIFLTHGDEGELIVKVVDFGIAKLRESAAHTLAGTVLGTPAYMSSEQASGMPSDQLDARSDVYSLGIVVYEMLSGRVPFHSTTPLGYLRKHMLDDPPPFRAVAPGLPVPPQVEAVVMKALKKEREERYPTALEFARGFAAAALPRPGAEVHQELPSTKIVIPAPEREPAAPPPRLANAPAPADIAVQPPPRVPPARIVKAPGARPQEAKPSVAISPTRTPANPPHFRIVESPSRLKYVVLGLTLMAAIAAVIWYFVQPAPAPPAKIPSASSDMGKSAPGGMVSIPTATFTMGRNHAIDPQSTPAHTVSVAAFELDRRPVTNVQYAEFVTSTSHVAPNGWVHGTYPEGQAEWPVTGVSWDDANAYCSAKGWRLPTEAEWEYAAHGNDGRLYPWGNDFSPALTNSAEAALGRPEAVGAHRDASSPFGVLDMSGNVWQWTADDYRPYPGRQPTFVIPADAKAIRGGSYQSDRFHVTTTTRNLDHASKRSPTIGFRCAK